MNEMSASVRVVWRAFCVFTRPSCHAPSTVTIITVQHDNPNHIQQVDGTADANQQDGGQLAAPFSLWFHRIMHD